MIKWPWQSKVMLDHPWVMQLFMLVVALIGSVITWSRMKKSTAGKKDPS